MNPKCFGPNRRKQNDDFKSDYECSRYRSVQHVHGSYHGRFIHGYGVIMLNELVTHKDGTRMVFGAIAHKVFFGRIEVPKIFKLDASENFHLFELVDGRLVHRAAQSTLNGAKSYVKGDASNYLLTWGE
jgi:hypothetical protein